MSNTSTSTNSRDELHGPYWTALRAELVDSVTATRRHRVPRKTKLIGAGVVAAAVLGSGSALAYSQLSSRPVTDHNSARCYTAASSHGTNGSSFPGTTIAVADGSQVSDALSVCADMWRQGVLRSGVTEPHAPDPDGSFPVPPLAACVLSDGRAAIVPGTSGICQTLGMTPAAGS